MKKLNIKETVILIGLAVVIFVILNDSTHDSSQTSTTYYTGILASLISIFVVTLSICNSERQCNEQRRIQSLPLLDAVSIDALATGCLSFPILRLDSDLDGNKTSATSKKMSHIRLENIGGAPAVNVSILGQPLGFFPAGGSKSYAVDNNTSNEKIEILFFDQEGREYVQTLTLKNSSDTTVQITGLSVPELQKDI